MREAPLGAKIFGLAAIYFVVSKLGLLLATGGGGAVTLVWPSAGLALAALVLFGTSLWPAIAIGAFVTNVTVPGIPIATALGIAVGNTLEAFAGAKLLRARGVHVGLARISDVVAFVGLGAVVSTLLSATVGTISLCVGRVTPWSTAVFVWRTWWAGDAFGDLIVTPILFAWSSLAPLAEAGAPAPKQSRLRTLEALVLAALVVAVSLLVFRVSSSPGASDFAQPYAVFPFLVWAATRFGVRGATTANMAVSAISIYAHVRGVGPFARATLNDSLLLSHAFLATAVITSLALGAAVAERDHAIAVRERFLSIASHELMAPLTPLTLLMPRLSRLVASDGREEVTRVVASFDRQVKRLKQLISDLLDVARYGTGHFTIEREECDLSALVRETIQDAQEALTQAGCPLELKADKRVVGSWDRRRLQQVISNLLTNAMKFGGNRPISVSVDGTNDWATLAVIDHGIGVAKQDQERIFALFERAVGGDAVSGLGLGLYISREIVARHNGSIRVESEPGSGATFIVELPVA